MNDRKRSRLKRKLDNEYERLTTELSRLTTVKREALGYGNHMADDATEVFEQAKDLALRQNLERQLELVAGARDRFAGGTYGICERCGENIDFARLKALPYAPGLLRCQQRVEKRA